MKLENSLEQSNGKYRFDGDGKRIKKEGIAPNGQLELTVFVYDAGGKLIGEYSTNVETAAPKVQYLTADHLGSPRINTDQNGTVTSRTDYMPYGEQIIELGGRASNERYVADDVREGYTGYENDEETGLDYAQARYFASGHGRFSSSDDFLNDSDPMDPQCWNKYAYVRNNPVNSTDPTGEKVKYRITIDTDKRTVTVTAIATVGIWSTNYGKADLGKAAKRIEAGIEGKWNGAWTDGGWKFDFNAQVSVQVFDKAKSTDDVLNTNPNIMNVVQLENLNATNKLSEVYNQLSGNNSSSKNWSLTTKTNPEDGTKPDVAMWDFGNSAQDHADSEPAHEFSHLLGVLNQGTTGTDLIAPGSGQAAKMSWNDFEKVVGNDARYFRDSHQNYVMRNPNTKLRRFQYFIWRGHCCK